MQYKLKWCHRPTVAIGIVTYFCALRDYQPIARRCTTW